MGTYDSPGFVAPLPGGGRDRFGMPAGTNAPEPHELAGQAVDIMPVYGGNFQVQVDGSDVNMPAQESLYRDPGRELISGVDGIGQTGAGTGRVRGPSHPNAANQGGQPS